MTVDTLPPTKNPTPTVTGTVTDGSSGVTVNVYDSTDTLVQGPLPATVNGAKWSVPLASLADGAYTITATSSKGFTAYNTLIVDTKVADRDRETLPPTNNATPTLTGTVSDPVPSGGIAGVTVVIGTQTLMATLSSLPVTETSTMWTWTWSAVVPTVLASVDGTYNIKATATDKAGNVSNTATGTLTLDTGKPTVTIDGQVATSSHADVDRNGHRSGAEQRDFQRDGCGWHTEVVGNVFAGRRRAGTVDAEAVVATALTTT